MNNTPRNIEVDTIRTLALFGICIVNLPFLSMPVDALFVPPSGRADQIAAFAVEALFQGKFFLLFSFVFGWGLHVQEGAAAQAGKSFGARFGRRLLGLALIGMAHGILVFTGDILLLYALLGVIIWPLRHKSPADLGRFARWMLPVAALAMGAIAVLSGGSLPDMASGPNLGTGLGGSFAQATATRFTDWPPTFVFIVLFNGPLALAAFALGIAASKVDFFAPGNPQFLRLSQATPVLAATGLALNLFYAASTSGLWPQAPDLVQVLGLVALTVAAPMLSASYLVAIVWFARKFRPNQHWLASGRNSLSGYVLHGLLAGFVMGGYGLGYFGTLGHATLIGLAITLVAVEMALIALWLQVFKRGPLETLLRWITQGPANPRP